MAAISNTDGVLSNYNALLDKNLSGYFSNTKHRRHLIKSGLITKDGRITSEQTYRMKMAKKEHRDNVRDLLASAIVDKALDMERMRQHEIKKRLEELYKIELVHKVRSGRGKSDRLNDVVALLTPRSCKKTPKDRKAKSAAVTKREKTNTKLPKITYTKCIKKLYNNDYMGSGPGADHVSSDKKKMNPHPPSGKSKKKKRNIHRGLMLAKSDQMIAHRVQLQSMAEVTMKYLGCSLNLVNDMFPSNKLSEIQIIQQHCGASTICVFRELLPANTLFTFVSRRHRGSPFGLTIYINGIQNIRISSCCEYKHRPGHKVGGKNSQFGLVAVHGAAPCYRCQIRLNLLDVNKQSEAQNELSSSDEEAAVKSYDIIVSRAGTHSQSKTERERPASASVMTQTLVDTIAEQVSDVDVEEKYEYEDEEFEEFQLNQEELSSENEINTATQSDSDSQSESESEEETKNNVKEEDSDSIKSSDSDEDKNVLDIKDEEDKKENEIDEKVKESPDYGETSSSESEQEIETKVAEELEIVIDGSKEKVKSEQHVETREEQDVETSHVDLDNVAGEDLSSDNESTLSVFSSSSSNSSPNDSGDEKEVEKEEVEEEEKEDVDLEGNDDTQIEIQEADVIKEDAADEGINKKDDDKANSDVADTTIAEVDDETKAKLLSEDNIDESDVTESSDEGEDSPQKNEDADEKLFDDVNNDNDKSESDEDHDVRAASIISRESTMLTGNEDGNFDSRNNTIQFNEEVDVVTYLNADGTSTEEEIGPHADESEGELSTLRGNVVLADLGNGDQGDPKRGHIEIDSDDEENVVELTMGVPQLVRSNSILLKRHFEDGTINTLVSSWKHVEIENLYLTETQSSELLKSIEKHHAEIESLSLKNTIVDGGIEMMKNVMKTANNLKSLNLCATEMGPEEMEHLVEILLDGTQKIEKLVLRSNPIDDEGTAILMSALGRLNCITSLDISECKVSDDGAEALFDYLSGEKPTLTELKLSSNKELTLEGWRYISSALKTNTTLLSLSLSHNDIGDSGIEIISQGIVQNKSLMSLDVKDNLLTDIGGQVFYESMQKCTTLKSVMVIPDNSFSDDLQKKFYLFK